MNIRAIRNVMMNGTAFRPKRMGGVSHKGLATNRVTPNGGVTNPTAILTTMMIPRWITSMLSSVSSGISMGARISRAGPVSMTMPIKSRATLMMSRISTFEWKLLVINCARMVGICRIVRTRPNAVATAIISARGGQSTAGFSHEPKDFSYLYGLINKYTHDQCIDHGHTGDLSSGDYAGVDPAQQNDRGQQCPEAVLQQGEKPHLTELNQFGIDPISILTFSDTVEYRIGHQADGDQNSGDNAGDEQLADGGSSGHSIHNKGNTGRDDDTQTGGGSYHRTGKLFIVSQREKDWNGHGTYCGAGCGAGTGDRTIEQAGSDDGTGDPTGNMSQQIGKDIEDFFRNAALCHDDAGEDEQGSGQDAGTVTSTNDASEHELYVAGKIRVNESGGHSGTDEGQNQRESHQDAYNKNNDNS